jgi:hypothetical protein
MDPQILRPPPRVPFDIPEISRSRAVSCNGELCKFETFHWIAVGLREIADHSKAEEIDFTRQALPRKAVRRL